MGSGMEDRYSRNFNTLTRKDQARLGASCVAIVGLGGLGGGVCELLSRIGVGGLILIDGDLFEPSNLNRQLLSREDNLGLGKAEAAGKRVKAVNSSVEVRVHSEFADPKNFQDLIRGADLVVDCLDTIQARFWLQAAARSLDIPLVSGAIAGASGQVTVIFPGDLGFELIYGPQPLETDSGKGIETRTGNLAHSALFIASLQASETVKILVGKGEVLRNKLLIADLWANSTEVMDLV